MSDDRREVLRRKYLSLGAGELTAAALFAALAAFVVVPRLEHPAAAGALWSALIPLLVILAQAGAYWLLARRWVNVERMPVALAALYGVFRWLNVVLLAAGLFGVILWWPQPIGVALLCLGVWLFGVIEYLNYFVVRLSYPFTEWFAKVGQWRVPRLMRDVNESADASGQI